MLEQHFDRLANANQGGRLMPFGLLPKDLAGEGQLPINVLSDKDDFAPGTHVDPSAVLVSWGDATYLHDLPIYNIQTQGNDVGAVYRRNDSLFRAQLPDPLRHRSREGWLIAAVVAGLGGGLAAFVLWRRK